MEAKQLNQRGANCPTWTASNSVIRDARGQIVAVLRTFGDCETSRLVAAAPELLALARAGAATPTASPDASALARALVERIDGPRRLFPPSSGGDGQRHEDRADRLFGGAAARQRAENREG